MNVSTSACLLLHFACAGNTATGFECVGVEAEILGGNDTAQNSAAAEMPATYSDSDSDDSVGSRHVDTAARELLRNMSGACLAIAGSTSVTIHATYFCLASTQNCTAHAATGQSALLHQNARLQRRAHAMLVHRNDMPPRLHGPAQTVQLVR